MSTDFRGLMEALSRAEVDFIIVGGIAGILHGAARATYDLDVVYSRSTDNQERLVQALLPLKPYLRGAPPGLPFRFDRKTIENGLNFTLTTIAGDLDLLGEIPGGGGYEALLPDTIEVQFFGRVCRCLNLARLIEVKRAAGRPRDLDAIAELELILERKQSKQKAGDLNP